jgi:replicative DNA helicase
MAKPNTTLKKTLDLLNTLETTQFFDKATYSQRRAALPFFRAITCYAFDSDEHPLPANADVESAQQALAEHGGAIAAGHVTVVVGPPRTKDWLKKLQREGEAIHEKLEREDTPTVEEAEPCPEPSAPTTTGGAQLGALADVQAPLAANTQQPASSAGRVPSSDTDPEQGVPPATIVTEPIRVQPDGGASVAVPAESADGALADWERPVELAEAYGPDFPIHALAPRHQRFVTELAEQVQIAVDVPALASLAMIGAAVAKTISVEIQPGDEQPANLFMLIVSPPGDGKTPLLGELRRPFDQVQAAMRDIARADAARADTEHRIAKLKLQRLEREAASSEDAEEKAELTASAVELRKQLELRRPGVPTLSTGDCTQLGLISLMDRNKGRLLLLTDEGDQLFSRVQQRSPRGAEDIDDMLKAYSGATIDRHDAQRELRVPAAALSIVATTQPRPFSKVMGVEAYHSKGFIGRFAIALPRSIQGARKQRRAGLSAEARSDYQTMLRGLLERPIPEVPTVLTLSEDAFQVFAACGAEADRQIMSNRDARFGAWIGKLRGLTARLAGILHVSDSDNHAVTTISRETMTRAVEISHYLTAHARVAYEHSERAALDEDPRRLLRWIRDTHRHQFTHAEAVVSFSGRLNTREVEGCLERLVVAKFLRERPAGKSRTGRPRKPSYLVNPYVFRSS